jgi:chaperone required for assembly of F1-ATPase
MAGGGAVTSGESENRRDFKTASLRESEHGYGLFLDDRAVKTPLGKPLRIPHEALAQAFLTEWEGRQDRIDFHATALTRLLIAAIDGGAAAVPSWREEILNYARSDLLCYRASKPRALAERQNRAWDPFLEWLRKDIGAALAVTRGIRAVSQPHAAIAAMARTIGQDSPYRLCALKAATTITGSAVLALALWKGPFAASEIFDASRLDEHFQQERWGVDGEAKDCEDALAREFDAAATVLSLID